MNWLVEVLNYDKYEQMTILCEMEVESSKKNTDKLQWARDPRKAVGTEANQEGD